MNVSCKFKYTETVTRNVFAAIIEDDTHPDLRIIVKFAKTYSVEVHNFYYNLIVAPQLYSCQSIGPYFMVVMEQLEGTILAEISSLSIQEAQQIESVFLCCMVYVLTIKVIQKAVNKAVSEGLVHGDLRAPNILITNDGPKIIDFDWSGKEGEVRYPIDLSMSNEWPEGGISLFQCINS